MLPIRRMAMTAALVLVAAALPILANPTTAVAEETPWTPIDGTPPAVSADGNPAT